MGTRRFKRATRVGLSWEWGRKTTIPGWDFGGYAWTFAKSKSTSRYDLPRGNPRRAPNRWHPEFLVGDRIRFETRPTKDGRVFCRKILVDFDLQALISSGKSTVPSRVNSAASANA